MPATPRQKSPRRFMIEVTGFFAGLIFISSAAVAAISSLASVNYLMYLIIVRASPIEALTTVGYMAIALGSVSLVAVTAGKVSKACFSRGGVKQKAAADHV